MITALRRGKRLLAGTCLLILLVPLFANSQLLRVDHEKSIVSSVGISQAEPLSPMILNLSMSGPPYLDQMARLTFNVTSLYESPDTTVQIVLPVSFVIVNGSLTWKGYLSQKEPFQLTVLVRAIRTVSF